MNRRTDMLVNILALTAFVLLMPVALLGLACLLGRISSFGLWVS